MQPIEFTGQQGHESQFLDYVQRLRRYRDGRHCTHIHLSRLKPHNRRDHHIRISANILDTPIQRFEGRIFFFANNDLMISTKGATVGELDDLVTKLRYLFSDDPLAHVADDDEQGFCTVYDLESNYAALLRTANRLAQDEEHRLAETVDGEDAPGALAQRILDPVSLAALETSIVNADVSGLIRRQSVCVVTSDAPPEPIFKEVYVGIAELGKAIAPGVDLKSDMWLFRHLTTVLDRRVMSRLVKKDDTDLASHFSLNLNISTVLRPEFLAFNADIGVGARSTILIELQLVDIFQDVAAYRFARDFLRELGFRICIDGISHLNLPYIDREELGADMMKVHWHQDIADGNKSAFRDRLRGVVNQAGTARIVMSRCDDEQAVASGHQIGISLFQGRHVDGLLASATHPAGVAAMSMKQAIAAGRSARR